MLMVKDHCIHRSSATILANWKNLPIVYVNLPAAGWLISHESFGEPLTLPPWSASTNSSAPGHNDWSLINDAGTNPRGDSVCIHASRCSVYDLWYVALNGPYNHRRVFVNLGLKFGRNFTVEARSFLASNPAQRLKNALTRGKPL